MSGLQPDIYAGCSDEIPTLKAYGHPYNKMSLFPGLEGAEYCNVGGYLFTANCGIKYTDSHEQFNAQMNCFRNYKGWSGSNPGIVVMLNPKKEQIDVSDPECKVDFVQLGEDVLAIKLWIKKPELF